MPGLSIDFADQKIQPCVPIHARFLNHGAYIYEGYVNNPNKSYKWDDPPGFSHPDSWYLSKVYNLEVEYNHTYFVDKLGVWVHNTNCGARAVSAQVSTFLRTLSLEAYTMPSYTRQPCPRPVQRERGEPHAPPAVAPSLLYPCSARRKSARICIKTTIGA
ncbi:MAG: hypothetical protein FWH15_06120 [Betaproteobacteria bacterium]|nr:hypothetical protein [Betaproteobacteria bacterium]